MKKLMSTFLMATLIVVSSFANDDKKDPIPASADKDIVDLAAGTDFLSTLVAAVKAGGLVDVLKGDGPFTVFAPTDEAFANLPEGTLESLLKPENKDQLVKILTYHVVPGSIKSSDLKNGMEVETVQGQKVKVMLADGKAMINDATVTAADIEATNGMVHVIDTVILPEM
ncbi:fasciclin domain-containing protein [Cyclobacterium roseum]|uniref:fasciclin domain-containing protein n=1 Tax=Cyclobacterium roseum TaxID=2666137 RepID=UPI001390DD86|nr:fasciclin domain-containing protein [Cyclobacterium roseum]